MIEDIVVVVVFLNLNIYIISSNSLINQTINSQRSNTRNKRYRPSTAPKATYFNKVEGRRVRGNRHVRRHENSK